MDTSTSKMGVGGLLKKLLPFVLPYRWLLILTLITEEESVGLLPVLMCMTFMEHPLAADDLHNV